MESVVILPYLGEFGWQIVDHVRFVHRHPAERKVVVCTANNRFLYPSAAEYVTDWLHPIPDSSRWNDTCYSDQGVKDRFHAEFSHRIREQFPGHKIVVGDYGCSWHNSDLPGNKFRPTVRDCLSRVDIAIAPRCRQFAEHRNLAFWSELTSCLRAAGLTVGVVGAQESSAAVDANIFAWDHPDGDTAGSIDLLADCSLYVGVDSGMTHMAALLDAPTLMIACPHPWPMFGLSARANKGFFRCTDAVAYERLDRVIGEVIHALRDAKERNCQGALYVLVDGAHECINPLKSLLATSGSRRIRVLVSNSRPEHCDELWELRDDIHEFIFLRHGVTRAEAWKYLLHPRDGQSQMVVLADCD